MIIDKSIKYKKDIAPIIELIDNLTSWDRDELLAYLLENVEGESLAKIVEELGFVNYNNLDVVKEVIDNNQETEILDNMYTYEIIDYLFNGWGTGYSSLDKNDVEDILKHLSCEEIASCVDRKDVSELLDYLYKYNSEIFNKWLVDRINKGEE